MPVFSQRDKLSIFTINLYNKFFLNQFIKILLKPRRRKIGLPQQRRRFYSIAMRLNYSQNVSYNFQSPSFCYLIRTYFLKNFIEHCQKQPCRDEVDKKLKRLEKIRNQNVNYIEYPKRKKQSVNYVKILLCLSAPRLLARNIKCKNHANQQNKIHSKIHKSIIKRNAHKRNYKRQKMKHVNLPRILLPLFPHHAIKKIKNRH